MIPIRFGPPARQLSGLFHPAAGEDRRHCLVLCNPMGQEAIRAQRVLRVLGDRLARSGFSVLRFDFFGTGDSDGEDTEGDVRIWTEDVRLAAGEVARRTGFGDSSWFGLRLGATLAALACARGAARPRRLVLWDPVVDGPAYLRELREAHAITLEGDRPKTLESLRADWQGSLGVVDGTEALGFPLTERLRSGVGELSADAWMPCGADAVTLVAAGEAHDWTGLADRFRAAGTPCEIRGIGSRIVWPSHEAMNSAIVPADALGAIEAAFREPQ